MNEDDPIDLASVSNLIGMLGRIQTERDPEDRRHQLIQSLCELTRASREAVESVVDRHAGWFLNDEPADPPTTIRRADVEELTPRQRQILARLLAGLEPRQIARDLGLTPHTVNTYLAGLYRRLGVANRIALMAGFIQIPHWLEVTEQMTPQRDNN